MAQGSDGQFYGTTRSGGTQGNGSVFKITSTGQGTELYSFTNGVDGNDPIGGLVLGGDGNLYGVSSFGGTNGQGAIFSVAADGTFTALYSFTGGNDGGVPNAGMMQAADGAFYGTTYFGGSNGFGGVFKFQPPGTLTELYSFTNGADGVNVSTVLTQGMDGNLYGTSQYGGTGGSGTIFRVSTGGEFSVVYAFTNGADGSFPAYSLRQGANGSYYGAAVQGGAFNSGTLFSVTPDGALAVLYSFTNGNDGSAPGGVILGTDGNFYGTTLYAGLFSGGTAFQLTPDGDFSTVLQFNSAINGNNPGALVEGTDLNFYAVTTSGGSNQSGTIVKFSSSVNQPGLGAQIPSAEYSALMDLYNATGGASWNQSYGWGNPSADYWYGVTVSSLQYDNDWNLLGTSDVETLSLGYNNLVGALAASIGNLSDIQTIQLNNNQISGGVPASLTELAKLQWLDLGWNQLTGSIPTTMNNLSSLNYLSLQVNQLTGGIPDSLGSLPNLQTLWLSYNQLGGTIPSSLGSLGQLETLYLSSDSLTGSIPETLTNLSQLENLAVNGNSLTNSLPAGIGGLTNLAGADFSYNILSGTIPSSLGNLALIQNLHLNNNAFTGSIPPELGNLSVVQNLTMGVNALSGGIPDNLTNLTQAQTLDVSWNVLSGSLPQGLGNLSNLVNLYLNVNYNLSGTIPESLGNCVQLQYFDCSWNSFTGSIPDSITNLVLLQNLYMDQNQFTNQIPGGIGSLTGLNNLSFAVNSLTGSIPVSISNLTQLTYLDFDNNSLTGPVPDAFDGMTNLQTLLLYVNDFYGSIPASLGNCTNLNYMDLSWNEFSNGIPNGLTNLTLLQTLNLQENTNLGGSLPSGFGNLARLQQLNFNSDALTGVLPQSIGGLTNLQTADFGQNAISNAIPETLTNLTALQWINFGGNQLSGPIPTGLGNMTNLQSFYLNNNLLTGPIPPSLGLLTNLQNLNLSYNNLSATIPDVFAGLAQLGWMDLEHNELTGPIPGSVGTLPLLNSLYLDYNTLSGNIPVNLGSLSNLNNLSLAVNGLSGPLPEIFTNLTQLHWLDLHGNEFTGTIPQDYDTLSGLQTIILYSNALSGTFWPMPFNFLDVTYNDYDFDTNSPNVATVQDMIDNGQTVNYLPQSIPTMLSEPQSETVVGGQTIELSVNVFNGSSFQWLLNGEPVTESTYATGGQSNSLTISNAQSGNAGMYQLVAYTSAGSATSTVASVVVNGGAPFVVSQPPANELVTVRSPVVLPALVFGSGPITYQWQFNGANLTDNARIIGSQSNILTIVSAVSNDAGVYQLFVQNSYGHTNTIPVHLEVSSLNLTNLASSSALQFNGTAIPTNTSTNDNFIRLTTAADDEAGSCFLTTPVNLGEGDSFSTFFSFSMSGGGPNGADGITFTVQSDAPTALGELGGGVGYQGISNSMAVEYHTYQDPGDPSANYVGIDEAGVATSLAWGFPTNNMNNGALWYSWIDYNGVTGDLEVRLSESTNRPTNALFAFKIDLVENLGSTQAYFGFTGATGGFTDEHDIFSWQMTIGSESTNGPTIALLGNAVTNLECHSTFVDPGVTAGEPGGSVTIVTNGTVNIDVPGTYYLEYQAIDSESNVAIAERTVNVADTIPPVLTLLGSPTITVQCHTAFTDPGATAFDACAGSVEVISSNTVDTNSPGTYTITYTASDPSGNIASTNRTVTVVDTIPPLVTLNGASVINVLLNSIFTDPGATALDTCAGVLPVTVVGSVNTSLLGSYTIDYIATDPSGNSATNARLVNVVTNVPPFIIQAPTNLYVQVGGVAVIAITNGGSSPFYYQWTLDGTNLTDGGEFSGSLTSALTISNAVGTDAGSYSVIITNLGGAITSAPTVLEVYIPTIGTNLVQNGGFETGDFQDWTVSGNGYAEVTGDVLFLHSGLYGAELGVGGAGYLTQNIPTTPGVIYNLSFWVNNPGGGDFNALFASWNGSSVFGEFNFPVSGWTNIQVPVVATGTNSSLVFEFVDDYSDLGLDDVSLTNETIILSSNPYIAIQPVSQASLVGSNATFTVGAYATEPLSYQWQDGGTNLSDGPNIIGSLTGNLLLTNIAASAAGSYTVVVSDNAGSVTSTVATLVVGLAPPSIAQAPVGQSGECGSTILLQAAGSGSGPLAYQWDLNGGAVPGATNTSLLLTNSSVGESGSYTFVVSSPYGSVTSTPALVSIVDTNIPVVTLNGAQTLTIDCPAAFVDPGATAVDACAGTLPVTISVIGNLLLPGTNYVEYIATNPSGVSATNTRTVILVGTNGPVVSILGANPLQVVTGQQFVDPGALGFDTCGESLPVTTNGTVNTSVPGDYLLTYTTTDPNGNSATNTRTVVVENSLQCVPAASGLLGLWTGDNTANDETGAHNGTLDDGATYAPGFKGEAFSLDGNSAYVDLGFWSPGSTWTIEGWVQLSALPPNRHTIAGCVSGCDVWAIAFDDGQFAVVSRSPSNCFQTTESSLQIDSNTWYHVAGTCDGTNASIYVNGILQSSAHVFPNYPGIGGDVRIGGEVCCSGDNFPGLVDELAIYNRALSAAEIGDIYNAGAQGKCSLTPEIAAFSPASGVIGNIVVITGTNFANPTGVLFNNVAAAFTSISANQINAIVPSGATTGPISVETAIGTNASSANFTVTEVPSCVPVPTGLVHSLSGDGNLLDEGGDNGIAEGDISYAPGEVGQAIELNGTSSYVFVPATSTLNVGISDGITLEAWINPSNVTTAQPIMEWNRITNNSSAAGAFLWIGLPYPSGNGSGSITANLFDTNGVNHLMESPAGLLTPGVFQDIAVSYDKTSGEGILYLNGAPVFQEAMGQFSPQTSYNLYLGARLSSSNYFSGLLDEIDIYNRGLSAGEIAGLYDAGSAGKCPMPLELNVEPTSVALNQSLNPSFTVGVVGSLPITFQWYQNNQLLDLPTATNATLTISNVSPTNAGTYFVIASNSLNSVTSAPVTLTVSNVPVLEVVNYVIPQEDVSGQPMEVTWSVTNVGAVDFNGTFHDYIYLATNSSGTNATLYGTFTFTGAIAAGQSVTLSGLITPVITTYGNQWIVAANDANSQVSGGNGETNVVFVSPQPVNIIPAPLPSLQILSIETPPTAYAGEPITIQWIETNSGTGGTSTRWVDGVWLSGDGQIDNTAVYSTSVQNSSYLNPDGSYENSLTFTLPQNLQGTFYFVVEADANQNVIQYSRASNTLTSAGVSIQQPSLPVLAAVNIVAPPVAFSGQSVALGWTVTNIGAAATLQGGWYDGVYLSTTNAYNSSSVFLGLIPHTGALAAGSAYTVTNFSVVLPIGITGQYYLLVDADVYNEVLQFSRNNDLGASPNPTIINLTPPPDLTVTEVAAPSVDYPAHNLPVTYIVSNIGASATPNNQWVDEVYLSPTPQYNATNLNNIFLGSFLHSGSLSSDQSYTKTVDLTVPDSLSGQYYVVVDTDAGDNVFELDKTNNIGVSLPVVIQPALPNLIVTSLNAPSSVKTGTGMLVSWNVANQGQVDTGASQWTDYVILSNAATRATEELAGQPHYGVLEPGASYTVTNLLVQVPYSLPAGNYDLLVAANANYGVFEGTNMADNTSSPLPITLISEPADLSVVSVTDISSGISGNAISLAWVVTNLGPAATEAGSWQDSAYLSTNSQAYILTNPVPSKNDILLGNFSRNANLAAGASYSNNANVLTSVGLNGDFTVYVVADSSDQVTQDTNRSNNIGFATNLLAMTPPVAPLLPDLIVTNIQAPTQAFSSQPFRVSWTVTNAGPGAAKGIWNDAVYLSLDEFLDTSTAVFVGYVPHYNGVIKGESYTVTNTFTLPSGLSDLYFVFVVADDNNVFGENATNTDNVAYAPQPVQIQVPPPADLVVTSVTVPTNGLAGRAAIIRYTVVNDGDAFTGNWTDSIYLSTNGQWNINDPLIGTVSENGSIAAAGTYTATVTNVLPGAVGNYYVIVRPDILNNLNENTEAPHSGASTNSISIDAPQLELGTPATGILTNEGNLYYKVYASAGQNLVLTLNTPDVGEANLFYVRYGAMPDANDYDFIGTDPLADDQQISIPTSQAGWYYIVVNATSLQGATESFSLEANVLQFALDSITPVSGGNAGSVTLELQGGQLTGQTTAVLVGAGGTTISGTVQSLPNSTEMFVTFNLTGVSPGEYNVQLRQPNQSPVTLSNAFTVTPGFGANLSAGVSVPGSVRPGFSYAAFVNYRNTGDEDLPAPLFVVTNANGLPMSLFEGAGYTNGPAEFLGIAQSGPAGVLPPGAQYSIPVYFQVPATIAPHSTLQFELGIMTPSSTPLDWSSFTSAPPPLGIPSDAWAAITTNLEQQAGPSVSNFLQALDDNATFLSLENKPFYDLNNLMILSIDKAMGFITPSRVQVTENDDNAPSRLLQLAFIRSLPVGLDHRFEIGPFGRGWTHSFEISLSQPSSNVVDIAMPNGTHRVFYQQLDSTWLPGQGENATLQSTGSGGFDLQEIDGISSSFDSDGRLVSVQEPNGNQITLTYSSGNLASISHSDGEQFVLAYNSYGRVTSLTDSAGQVVQYQYDASGEHLTTVIEPGGQTNSYTYVPVTGSPSDHALQSVTYPNGVQRLFAYDTFGNLSQTSAGDGTQKLQLGYDSLGGFHITNAIGAVTSGRLDDRAQILQRSDPLGNVVVLSYDTNYNPLTITTSTGQASRFAYDSQSRALSEVNPLGGGLSLGYTNYSRVAALHDYRSETTGYQYDSHGNGTATTYPDGSNERFAYDSLGGVTNYYNRRGQAIKCSLDQFGQLTNKLYPDGRNVSFQFDARGNLTNMTDSVEGVTSFTYDLRNLPSSITYPDGTGFTFSYSGDARTRRIGSDGYILNYGYDSADRLVTVSDGSSNQLAAYSYDQAGRLAQETKGNGTITTYSYDAAGEVLAITNMTGATLQSFFNYTYDGNGNRLTMTTADGVTTYQYDPLNELTGVSYPDGTQATYTYDAAGNRTETVDAGANTEYTINSLNQYSQAGNSTFAYDADGNLTSCSDSSGTTTFAYDADNHLISVVTPTNGTWQYGYDGLGHRNTVVYNGVTNKYLLDPAGMVDIAAEYDGGGNLIARYVDGHGLVSRIDSTGNAAYYTFDALGNTRQLIGSDGTVLDSYDYDAFGAVTSTNGPVPNPFQFSGRFGVMAEANGFNFMRQRYYSPSLGRFTSVDPIRLGGGLNLMAYVGNNPVNFSDPLGTQNGVWDDLCGCFTYPDGTPSESTESDNETLNTAAAAAAKPTGTIDVGYTAKAGGGTTGGVLVNLNNGQVSVYQGTTAGTPSATGYLMWSPTSPQIGANQNFSANGVLWGGTVSGGFGPDNASINWEAGVVIGPPSVGTSTTLVSPPLFTFNPFGPNNTQYHGPYNTQALTPHDPNDKTGPLGYGLNAIVPASQPLNYTITFVNSSNASAPAHTIVVNDQLDPSFNPQTFRLQEIVFGSNSLAIPPNRSFLETNLTISTAAGPIEVDVIAGVNVATGQLYWSLTGLDPATGQSPANPALGILPPDDANGDGEGRLTYTVTPFAGVTSGTQVTNDATIIFDNNEPIITDITTNELDAGELSSSATVTTNVTLSNTFVVSWTGTETNGESGISGFNIYVSVNGGPYQIWLANTTLGSAPYVGVPGDTYAFYSVALDNAGNVQAAPGLPNATVYVSDNTPPTLAPIPNFTTNVGDIILFTNIATDTNIPAETLTFGLLPGAPIGASVDPVAGVFTWQPSITEAGTTNLIGIGVTNSGVPPLNASQTFTVVVNDYVQTSFGTAAVQAGQSSAIALDLFSSAPLSTLSFDLNYPAGTLTNFGLASLAATIASANVQSISPTNSHVTITASANQGVQGNLQLGMLQFTALPVTISTLAQLTVNNITAIRTNATQVSDTAGLSGQIPIITPQPLLGVSLNSSGGPHLTLYGAPGSNYVLQTTTSLSPPIQWQNSAPMVQSNLVQTLDLPAPAAGTNSLYFRLYKQ